MEDNLNSHAYYHFINLVREVLKDENAEKEFAIPIQIFMEKIRYKNKSYVQIWEEINELLKGDK